MTTKEQLYRNPNYQRLNKKRREVAYLVLVEGTSFAAACKAKGLNQSRESQHKILQMVLAGRTDMDLALPEPARDDASIYDRADALSAKFDAFLRDNPDHPATVAYRSAVKSYNTKAPVEAPCSICAAACNLFSAVAGGKRVCRGKCHDEAAAAVLAGWRAAYDGVVAAMR